MIGTPLRSCQYFPRSACIGLDELPDRVVVSCMRWITVKGDEPQDRAIDTCFCALISSLYYVYSEEGSVKCITKTGWVCLVWTHT